MTKLKRYSNLKTSGVPWLGGVPEHWAVLPNRALFAEVKERDHTDEQMLSVTITKGIIPQRSLLEGSSKKDSSNLDRSAYKLVCPGDLAYNKMRAWQGAIGVSDVRGIVSPAYVVVRPRGQNCARYFHYLFRTPQFTKEAERWSYGITSDMWSLRPEHFRMIYSVLPPREEQNAVVRFLDQGDKRIRRFIAAKRRLIELMNEQKQALIQKAVTRGLDPSVRLKPSGLDWLGAVPEHWQVMPLKHAFQSLDYGISESTSDSGKIRVLTMGNIQDGEVSIPINGGVESVDSRLLLQKGDLLFNRTNSAELVGKVGLFLGTLFEVTFASYLVRLRPNDAMDPYFFNYLLNSSAILGIARQMAVPSLHQSNLNPTRYGRIQIAVPPPDEQAQITAFLRVESERLSSLINRIRRQVELAREYRTRLIADVVTGKLDVRDVELPPLEEAEEFSAVGDEGLDEAPGEEAELEPVEEVADTAD